MQFMKRIRELLHAWFMMWSHVLAGELIALSQPKTNFRR